MPPNSVAPTEATSGTADRARHVNAGSGSWGTLVRSPILSNGTAEMYRTEVPPTSRIPNIAGWYSLGLSAILRFASAISSLRSPHAVAPVGQASAHAVGRPFAWRSAHILHFLTRGNRAPHS